MYHLGLRANDNAKGVSAIPDFVKYCENTTFDHRVFSREWRFRPKPCKYNPTWNLGDEMWFGKEVGQGN